MTYATRRTRAIAFLRDAGAADLAHPGGDLFHHLVRTSDLLVEWEADEALALAGLCHAAYGTDGFPTPLIGGDERDRLRDLIGDTAEAIVHTYASCDRDSTYPRFGTHPLVMTDRLTGDERALTDDEAHAFAMLTIANELDIVRAGALPGELLAPVVEGLAAYAPLAAEVAAKELP